MRQPKKFTAREKAVAATREVRMRKRVYPGWIERGKLTDSAAKRQIELMEEIAEDYSDQAADEEAKGRLL